eukprot:COSAG01_NODE_582_length_15201_cov_7.218315_10_plen_299_part_00
MANKKPTCCSVIAASLRSADGIRSRWPCAVAPPGTAQGAHYYGPLRREEGPLACKHQHLGLRNAPGHRSSFFTSSVIMFSFHGGKASKQRRKGSSGGGKQQLQGAATPKRSSAGVAKGSASFGVAPSIERTRKRAAHNPGAVATTPSAPFYTDTQHRGSISLSQQQRKAATSKGRFFAPHLVTPGSGLPGAHRLLSVQPAGTGAPGAPLPPHHKHKNRRVSFCDSTATSMLSTKIPEGNPRQAFRLSASPRSLTAVPVPTSAATSQQQEANQQVCAARHHTAAMSAPSCLHGGSVCAR